MLSNRNLNSQSWWENTYKFEYLDINKITIPINNIGGLESYASSTFWEYNLKNYTVVFDQGPWIVGKVNGNIHLAISQWSSSYSPGPIINNNAAMNVHPEDSSLFRVYKIDFDDTLYAGSDYLEWPSKFGAPVNSNGLPVFFNDQTVWAIYNSLDSSISDRKKWNRNWDTLHPIPVEIHQLAHAYKSGQLNWTDDIVFYEWTIINKGQVEIDSAFFGLWTDIDFNDAFSNYPAVDSSIQLGYCWDPVDSGLNHIPLSVGYVLKYGPVVPSYGDTSIFKGIKKTDYKNLNLVSFHAIGDDAILHPLNRPAYSLQDAWNFARGLDGNGNIIIDPTTGLPTKFPFGGDPVNNTGYIYPWNVGGGAGFVMFSGPFNLAVNDTQWVMAALIVSTGEDYRDAIINLREKASIIQATPYDILVTKHSASKSSINQPDKFYLSQNFPNPFNNETKLIFYIPYRTNVLITVYDILGNKVREIMDEVLVPDLYEITINGERLSSGIYFYQLIATDGSDQFTQTKKMVLLK